MGYFGKTLAFWGLGRLPRILQSEPVDYSGFQPSAVMPSLKPAPQEQLRAGKTSETAENVPGTYTDCGKQSYQVLNICNKY